MSEILNHIVLGALYRYTVWLTNNNPPILFGNGVITEDVARAVENFFKAEGLDCDVEPDKNWKY